MNIGESTTFILGAFLQSIKEAKPEWKTPISGWRLRQERVTVWPALLIQCQISVFLFLFPLSLSLSLSPSRNWGPRASVQLHTTQLSMASFSICSLKGRYYTLTYKLGLPVNTPSFLPLPPLSSIKRAAYICLTHICVSLSPYTCKRVRIWPHTTGGTCTHVGQGC